MGMLDIEATRDLDICGLPGFFANEFTAIPIEDGCVRLFGGVIHRGLFVPQYYVNSPYQSILRGAGRATETAIAVSRMILRGATVAH